MIFFNEYLLPIKPLYALSRVSAHDLSVFITVIMATVNTLMKPPLKHLKVGRILPLVIIKLYKWKWTQMIRNPIFDTKGGTSKNVCSWRLVRSLPLWNSSTNLSRIGGDQLFLNETFYFLQIIFSQGQTGPQPVFRTKAEPASGSKAPSSCSSSCSILLSADPQASNAAQKHVSKPQRRWWHHHAHKAAPCVWRWAPEAHAQFLYEAGPQRILGGRHTQTLKHTNTHTRRRNLDGSHLIFSVPERVKQTNTIHEIQFGCLTKVLIQKIQSSSWRGKKILILQFTSSWISIKTCRQAGISNRKSGVFIHKYTVRCLNTFLSVICPSFSFIINTNQTDFKQLLLQPAQQHRQINTKVETPLN